MLLKYFYDQDLAHASYFVGCQRVSEAIIVDPGRDIAPYLQTASQEGMEIVGVAETHIHADYVSGARELAQEVGATLYISDEGDENWKYHYATQYKHQLLRDGDTFMIGNIKFEALHTPGHTPESISFLLTDLGGGADNPMGIFSGDFVFVGAIGRPDLLEKAAGVQGNALTVARTMYHSLSRFKQLPDYLQVWPTHGAGSACGKGLGAIPSTTVGYEKLFNPALAYENEDDFVNYLLADQPEPPKYFANMKQVNKDGPRISQDLSIPSEQPVAQLLPLLKRGAFVIDTRFITPFAIAHVPNTINIPLSSLATWAGWYVPYDQEIYLITDDSSRAIRVLHEIGVDHIAGYFDAHKVATAGLNSQSYQVKTAYDKIARQIIDGDVTLIDVRAQTEWDEGHLPNAQHIMLGYLQEQMNNIPPGKPIVLQCRSGSRSAIAASIVQANRTEEVINLAGGIHGWANAGMPIIKS